MAYQRASYYIALKVLSVTIAIQNLVRYEGSDQIDLTYFHGSIP